MIYNIASGVNKSMYGASQEPIKMLLENEEQSWESKSMIKEIFYMDKIKTFAAKYTSETSLGGFKPVGRLCPLCQ